ncbi:MAG TPA: glycosyltransferase [Anaerolineaceae bacterium]|nr:glycosyltransferase [Anaerolineaceae bacterium]
MRICVGLTEIAGIAATYAGGFRQLGHEVYSVVTTRNPYYLDAAYDCVIDDWVGWTGKEVGMAAKARRALARRRTQVRIFETLESRTDLFIFLFGSSFLPGYADYRRICRSGARLVSVFLGSDIRHWYPFQQEMQALGMEAEVRPFIDGIRAREIEGLAIKRRRVQAAERYASLILSQPGNGQLQTRPYRRMTIPLDLSQYRCQIPLRRRPRVLHIPSWRVGKGTAEILAAVEALHGAGVEFDFQLVENTPNRQVREMLAAADIVVDELYADTVGVLSTEAMASGCVALVHYPTSYAGVAPDCPAVHITQDTLTDRLREVILDLELRQRLAAAGRLYAEAHHDHVAITRQILAWLEPSADPAGDPAGAPAGDPAGAPAGDPADNPAGDPVGDFIPTFYQQLKIPAWVGAEDLSRVRAVWLQRLRLLTGG